MSIQVDISNDGLTCPSEDEIQLWLNKALIDYPNALISIKIVGASDMQNLNAQYRQKNKPTNVLSFPCPIPQAGEAGLFLGDLVLCPEVIEQEAQEQQKSIKAHWAHMLIHGALHLLGYDHQQDQAAEEMEALETQILQSLGFSNPYGVINE